MRLPRSFDVDDGHFEAGITDDITIRPDVWSIVLFIAQEHRGWTSIDNSEWNDRQTRSMLNGKRSRRITHHSLTGCAFDPIAKSHHCSIDLGSALALLIGTLLRASVATRSASFGPLPVLLAFGWGNGHVSAGLCPGCIRFTHETPHIVAVVLPTSACCGSP
jgi:hypothetical protein